MSPEMIQNVYRAADAIAFFILFLMSLGALLTKEATVAARLVCIAALGIVALAIASCATLPETAPQMSDDQERCTGLVALACSHDDHCGMAPPGGIEQCLSDNAPSVCARVTDLTQGEADECALAILREPCPGDLPEACLEAVYGRKFATPQPKVQAL